MIESWKNADLSLGERCVLFSENEMKNGVCEDKLNSFTSSRIREYFSICTRLVNGKETKLNLNAGNWCSSGGCFALQQSLLPGEVVPHGYRVGVVEVVADLKHNNLYQTIDQVRNGDYTIKVGDVIIFDRSIPNKPETQWFRHFGRCYSVDSSTDFKCISGNNGGKWKISSHKISQTNLLGFGSYPSKKDIVLPNISTRPPAAFDSVNIKELAPSEDSGSDISPKFFDKFFSLFSNK